MNGFEFGGQTTAFDEGYIKVANNERGIYLSPTVGIRFVSSTGNEMHLTTAGNLGIGTTNPAAKLDVDGEVKFGNTASTCNSTTEGQQRYNSTSKKMEYCNGSAWTEYGTGSGGVTAQWTGSSSCSFGAGGQCTTTTPSCPAGYIRSGCSASSYYAAAGAVPSGSDACTCNGVSINGNSRLPATSIALNKM